MSFFEIKLPLGAYQTAEVIAVDLGEQYTESGNAPRSALVTFTGSENFVVKQVTLALDERAQRDLILALDANLNPGSERAQRTLAHVDSMPYGSVTS